VRHEGPLRAALAENRIGAENDALAEHEQLPARRIDGLRRSNHGVANRDPVRPQTGTAARRIRHHHLTHCEVARHARAPVHVDRGRCVVFDLEPIHAEAAEPGDHADDARAADAVAGIRHARTADAISVAGDPGAANAVSGERARRACRGGRARHHQSQHQTQHELQ
jgi:hypothetical protein